MLATSLKDAGAPESDCIGRSACSGLGSRASLMSTEVTYGTHALKLGRLLVSAALLRLVVLVALKGRSCSS
eukprot:5831042-Pleurochrysis_carterae.AAC.1